MKKLYTFGLHQRGLAGLMQERLKQEEIACLVKNEDLFVGLGEIPFVELFPELWVVDDEVYPRAKLLIKSWLEENPQREAAWICPGCNELLEGQFGACWKCGKEKNSTEC